MKQRLVLAFLLLAGVVNAQYNLQEVQVVSQQTEIYSQAYRLVTQISSEAIAAIPATTVADLLMTLPGLDIRTRGASGAQADVSMRGGTFDQVMVLLNGVCVSDAQTGHYAMNIPVPLSAIERIEVLEGAAASLTGGNAFCGAINIVTRR
ncbi:MAG: TonB-dependent receptor plug domain-containing protein, partial [Paludibacteraceae bacterium]|nr:TonB-dependent receptor plug domain-containing protein [Paludibacteraceae bacterium]